MAYRIDRRNFLRIVATASGTGLLSACSSDEDLSTDPADVLRVFPQGVASGDPKPDAVILWTRVAPEAPGAVTITYEMATDEAFTNIVAQGEVAVDAATDHTLRLKPTGLSPYTSYFYRFIAQGVISDTGRTKTAPAPDQDVNVRFAFASCQDFNGRYYHAWRALAEQESDVDFVVHLGDYIYETEGDPRFQEPTEQRKVALPDGLPIGSEEAPYSAALTLADYRTLYRTYRSDPDLKRAHQLFPFITIWDDHEFADDSWQDHATHFNDAQGDEKDSTRREAASQAWFEYQPADVPYDAAASYPADITIYRALRYGKHVELVLTDQRYYRDDHLIDEGPTDPEVGKIFPNSSLGARQLVIKEGFDPKEAAAKPTMLGSTQKQWLIETLSGSDATWKFWGNETQLAQMAVDLTDVTDLPESFQKVFYFTVDQWDGYRSERAEILQALAGVQNLVALTGDIHAFYACLIHPDFDMPTTPTCVEYTVAGISSLSVQEIVERVVATDDVLSTLGLDDEIADFDGRIQAASPHYVYAKSKSNGIAVVDVDGANEIRVSFLDVGDVTSPEFAGVASRVSFRTPAGSASIEML